MSEPTQKSIKRDMIIGSAWMVGMRWVIKGIGFISMMILARLLEPEDFGLVALAMIIVGFIDVMTSFGVDMALIQNQEANDRDFFDTGWTLRLIQTCFAGVVLVVLAPYAADYYNEARVETIMYVLAAAVALAGFENIGVVAFRKDLQFHKEFKFRTLQKVCTFFITIGLAFYLQNFWALVIGSLAAKVFDVILSYVLHPYRPKFSFAKTKTIWGFSQWMLVYHIGAELKKNVDMILIGRFFDSSAAGVYRVSQEVANLPTVEMIWPLSRALFPGFSKLANDLERLGAAYLNVLAVMATLLIPCSVGIVLVSENLVAVVLGAKWTDAVGVLQWLAVYGGTFAIAGNAFNIFAALGKVSKFSMILWAEIVIVIIALYFVAQMPDVTVEDIAFYRAMLGLCVVPIYFQAIVSVGVLSWKKILLVLWRPSLAALVMYYAILAVTPYLALGALLNLVIQVAAGGVTFAAASLLLWFVAGKPDGGDMKLAKMLTDRLGISK